MNSQGILILLFPFFLSYFPTYQNPWAAYKEHGLQKEDSPCYGIYLSKPLFSSFRITWMVDTRLGSNYIIFISCKINYRKKYSTSIFFKKKFEFKIYDRKQKKSYPSHCDMSQ